MRPSVPSGFVVCRCLVRLLELLPGTTAVVREAGCCSVCLACFSQRFVLLLPLRA